MTAPPSTLASGVRSVAVAGDITNSVIVTGDDVTIELRVDTDDALLANLLAGSRVPRRTPRPLPLDGVPPPSPQHVDRRDEADVVRAAVGAGRTFEVSGPREIGKTFVVRSALAGAAALPDGSVYVFAKGKRYADVLQECHEAFVECDPPAVVGEQQLRRDLAGRQAVVVLDSVELERDELRQLATILPGCHLVLVARERALGEGRRLVVGGLAAADALTLVEQELDRPLEAAERPAAERVCLLLEGHPFELRQAAAAARDGERSFTGLAAELAEAAGEAGAAGPGGVGPGGVGPGGVGPGGVGPGGVGRGGAGPGGGAAGGGPAAGAGAALADLLLGSLPAEQAAIVEQLAALRGATVGAEHIAALAGTDDLMPALRALEQRRLIASASPRFRIAGALHEHASHGPDAVARATAYFARWARMQRARPDRLLTEAPALLELLARAEGEGRDADVIALGRASDAAFAHGRRWETWGAVLDAVLAAAERTDDRSARAWALHQLGTRAYCLGDAGHAVASLQEALRLREELGERANAEITRYNLDFIATPPVAGDHGGPGPGRGGPGPAPRRSLALVAVLAVVLAGLGAAVAIGLSSGDDPAPVPTTEPAITNGPTATLPAITRTAPTATTATTATQTQTQTTPTTPTTPTVTNETPPPVIRRPKDPRTVIVPPVVPPPPPPPILR